jgi:hypothetical protein
VLFEELLIAELSWLKKLYFSMNTNTLLQQPTVEPIAPFEKFLIIEHGYLLSGMQMLYHNELQWNYRTM